MNTYAQEGPVPLNQRFVGSRPTAPTITSEREKAMARLHTRGAFFRFKPGRDG